MNVRMKQLRDLVVALDRSDRKVQAMSPEAYRAAAGEAQKLVHEQMGLLPMADFAGPVNALQTLAENIFFGFNGCFADIDGTGRAAVAGVEGKAFVAGMRAPTPAAVGEIAEALLARLRFRQIVMPPSTQKV